MQGVKHSFLMRMVKAINLVLIAIPFIYCWYHVYGTQILNPFFRRGNWVVIVLFVLIYAWIAHTYDGFRIQLSRISDMVYSQALALLITHITAFIVICLLTKKVVNPLALIATLVTQILISVLWSYLANRWFFYTYPPKKTAVVYDKREGMETLVEEYGFDRRYLVEKVLHVDDCIKNIDLLKGMETVFLSGIRSSDRNIIIKYCVENRITALVIPRVGDLLMSSATRLHMFHLPILKVSRQSFSLEYGIAKRAMDILLSIIAVVVLSPICLITALAILLDDGSPIFYKQKRLTRNRREFEIIKFRSMKKDAEKYTGAVKSTGEKDDRITRVGRIIRMLRIDEIPQLVNIIKGDMSIVGPRPERPELANEIEKELPEFNLRLQVKAGLTGYAQVYGKYNTDAYDKLQMDLMYIASASIFEDFKIILATIKILFKKESTEGAEAFKNEV